MTLWQRENSVEAAHTARSPPNSRRGVRHQSCSPLGPMLTSAWQRLLHRWFVEYNPLYLLSATFVLVGVNKLSEALARSAYSAITVAAVAELYAWTLIASAAFLMRVGLRRPAVMLALLTALYQCDPTLHTETCAYLGSAGVPAAALWVASFIGKIFALGWAFQLRFSLAALLVPALGALGVVLIPPFLSQVNPTRMTSVVTIWLFALFAGGLWGSCRVTSRVALDPWAQTVFERVVRATWAIWAILTLSHVWFWADEFGLKLAALVPATLLLLTRWSRRELHVWIGLVGALLLGRVMPHLFATTALLAAGTLVWHAFSATAPQARARFAAGAVSASYLALWTAGWWGGAWPLHGLVPDALFVAGLLLTIWKLRVRISGLLPLGLGTLHLGLERGILRPPRSELEWALTYIGLGFATLFTSLFASWRLREADSQPDRCGEG